MSHNLLPDRAFYSEMARPWKLFSFMVGMAWLLYGAHNYGISDWDVGISILMGGFTYLCAPWSVGVILVCARDRPRYWPLWVVAALLVALAVVDWLYVAYHTVMGNQMFRLDNFYASSALYFLAGAIWLYRGSFRGFVGSMRALVRDAHW